MYHGSVEHVWLHESYQEHTHFSDALNVRAWHAMGAVLEAATVECTMLFNRTARYNLCQPVSRGRSAGGHKACAGLLPRAL